MEDYEVVDGAIACKAGCRSAGMRLRSSQRTALRRAVEAAVVGKKWRGVDLAIDVDPINIL